MKRLIFLLAVILFGAFNANAAQALYPSPFPGTVSSLFAPRDAEIEGATKFHMGLDFAPAAGTPIPSLSAGAIQKISAFPGATSTTGNSVRIAADGNNYFEYYHMFQKTKTKFPVEDDNKQFTLDKVQFQVVIGAIGGPLRIQAVYSVCNVMFVHSTSAHPPSVALVDQTCKHLAKTIQYRTKTYTIKTRVAQSELIGPVGNTSSVGVGQHLHLVFANSQGRLLNPAAVLPPLQAGTNEVTLIKNNYSTQELATGETALGLTVKSGTYNLNGMTVKILGPAGNEVYQKVFNYGGAPDSPGRIGIADGSRPVEVFTKFEANSALVCTTKSTINQSRICPTNWNGQRSKDPVQIKFYVPAALNTYPAGKYTVAVTLLFIDGSPSSIISLPLDIIRESPGGFTQLSLSCKRNANGTGSITGLYSAELEPGEQITTVAFTGRNLIGTGGGCSNPTYAQPAQPPIPNGEYLNSACTPTEGLSLHPTSFATCHNPATSIRVTRNIFVNVNSFVSASQLVGPGTIDVIFCRATTLNLNSLEVVQSARATVAINSVIPCN